MNTFKENSFVLKPDGKIYWVKDMPENSVNCKGKPYCCPDERCKWLVEATKVKQALQSAIDNAVEVSNQEEVEDALLDKHIRYHGGSLTTGQPYFLVCSVEKKDKWFQDQRNEYVPFTLPVALVTFPESGEKIKLFPCGENACALSSSVGGKITACKDKCQLDSGEKQSQEETQEQLWDILHEELSQEFPSFPWLKKTFIITRK
jgi:hypothetical protein